MSEIEICNLALSKLGEAPITNLLNPVTRIEELCKHWYYPCRRATLEEYEWSFAIERFTSNYSLVPVGDEVWGFAYQHVLPANLLRLLTVRETPIENAPSSAEWQRENNKLLANAPTLYCRGIFDVEDATVFSPAFVQALAVRLALEMSVAVTGNMDVYDRLTQEYLAKLTNAGNIDAMQGRRKRVHATDLVTRR